MDEPESIVGWLKILNLGCRAIGENNKDGFGNLLGRIGDRLNSVLDIWWDSGTTTKKTTKKNWASN